MIRIEHVNLVVKNIDVTRAFLLSAFPQWRVRGGGRNTWSGRERNWCHVGDDDYYITLNDNAEGENRDLSGHAPGLAHIGFSVDDSDAIKDRLIKAGYEVRTYGADHPYRKTVYFIDPEGFEFEFMEYLSDVPTEKNQYGGETSTITRPEPALAE
ncbi:MAG: glyoxalase [Rhodobiaceae bacterium]|nr:MAG: glyoxalase [Rhodobiaceae bacterium]